MKMLSAAALALAAIPAGALGQEAAPPADPAGVMERFMQILARGDHQALGALVAERVGMGEGQTLRRDQVIMLFQSYTMLMFGPLRDVACTPPADHEVTCTMRFQSRSLRESYTVENGLISQIEILPLGGARR